MVHKAAYDANHGKGLKILTPKQMLQRLPITLANLKLLKKYTTIQWIQ